MSQTSRPKPHRQFLLEDPARAEARRRFSRRRRRVFTGLILLAVVGIVARGVASDVMAARGYAAVMKADLNRLVEVQRAYFAENERYGTRDELGRSFVPSQGVSIRIRTISTAGWVATARHVRTTVVCRVEGNVGEPDGPARCS